MPDSLKEALRSDGTAFTVVSDSNIASGVLLSGGVPRYPIVISLASEAVRNDEIAALTNYVAAGGFLFVGSSSFTRQTNGASRGDFALGGPLGVRMVAGTLANWGQNSYLTKQAEHRLTAHLPAGQLTWRMPAHAEEITWGVSPSHPFLAPHDIWRVQATDATVLAAGDAYPYLTVKSYGKGCFIYYAPLQPLIGHGGWAPTMHAYLIFRRAIEWAFENARLPVPRLSPWPYPYDAAFMVRHDLENEQALIANIEASAQFEYTNGARGDYYFCTGTLREQMSASYDTNAVVSSLRRAISSYGATIGPHNGGLKNPVNLSLSPTSYDYWHWGPDEALDVTPPGYASGKAYALASLSTSFRDIESWFAGLANSNQRIWVSPYFNATREDSFDLQSQLNVKVTGDQKLGLFPHWTLSTRTPGRRYGLLSQPVSDWYVGGLVAQSLEPWHPPGVHTATTVRNMIDFYYGLGGLINAYSHTLSTGQGDAGDLAPEYVRYSLNPVLHPRLWSANGLLVYQWWLQRSNVQLTVSHSTNGYQFLTSLAVRNSPHTNTAVELLLPSSLAVCNLQVRTNGQLAGAAAYRLTGQSLKVRVGTAVTNVGVSYYTLTPGGGIYLEKLDGVAAPALPAGWSTGASGAQSSWTTQTAVRDTAPNAAWSPAPAALGVNELVSPPVALPAGVAQLAFRNRFELEAGSSGIAYDGGVLEIKIGSAEFADFLKAGGRFLEGGYTGLIDSSYGNPLAGRQAWSGTSGAFITTVADLPEAASGQVIQLRWRCGTDNGNGGGGWWIDSVSLSNQVCLCCVATTNSPPSLPAQGSRSVNEMTLLTVTNTASDPDQAAQVLSYQLLSPPSGAAIDANGLITWTPSEAQGPGVYTLATRVTDNGSPPLSTTNSFSVTVNEVNRPPVLPAQPDRLIEEGSALTVTNTATDPDLPANLLSYSLGSPPSGATISSGGILTWTPTAGQGPSTNRLTTIVSDHGTPLLKATNTFQVIVTQPASAPVITIQPASRTNFTGTTANFNVVVSGSTPAYQWIKNGTNTLVNGGRISGATSATLTLSDLEPANAGAYAVIVTNLAGSVTSAPAWLTIIVSNPPPLELFADDFTRPTNPGTLSPWVTHSGTWTIHDGLLEGHSKAQSFATIHLTNLWENYSVEADIRFSSGAYGGGIGGRLNPGNGVHYAAWVHPEGSAGGARTLKLLKFKNWKTWTYNSVNAAPMAQTTLSAVGTNWHHLKLSFRASEIEVHYDGNQVLVVIDTESSPLLLGAVCLDTRMDSTTHAMFVDNFRVLSLPKYGPVNPQSPLIHSVRMVGGSAVITWTTEAGFNYRLQYADTLLARTWNDLSPDLAGTGSLVSYTNLVPSVTQRFYRVLVLP
jgi:hypothetical protein